MFVLVSFCAVHSQPPPLLLMSTSSSCSFSYSPPPPPPFTAIPSAALHHLTHPKHGWNRRRSWRDQPCLRKLQSIWCAFVFVILRCRRIALRCRMRRHQCMPISFVYASLGNNLHMCQSLWLQLPALEQVILDLNVARCSWRATPHMLSSLLHSRVFCSQLTNDFHR
jgi:hypothetical protein